MTAQLCPMHRTPLELVPVEPRSRCPGCHRLTYYHHFELCPECGSRVGVEEPEPRWECPLCSHAAQKRAPQTLR